MEQLQDTDLMKNLQQAIDKININNLLFVIEQMRSTECIQQIWDAIAKIDQVYILSKCWEDNQKYINALLDGQQSYRTADITILVKNLVAQAIAHTRSSDTTASSSFVIKP